MNCPHNAKVSPQSLITLLVEKFEPATKDEVPE
jgi:hypothetical protein